MTTKEKVGIVVSNKMDDTFIVAVQTRIRHKRYGKLITRTKRYVAHDVDFFPILGDSVRIKETRPISKTKKWAITNILR
jgi:small subunit ribosomal protein S17